MIEKRTMGYVDFEYPNLEAVAKTVMFDTEENKVVIYHIGDGDDWCEPNCSEHFFGTVEEAANALEEHKRWLVAKMDDVKQYLSSMNNWGQIKKEDDPLYHLYSDYLPYPYSKVHESDNYYARRSDRLENENKLLVQAIRCGTLSIRAVTFNIKDIVYVKWGNERAELHLTGDRKTETADEWEFNVVRYLFGGNISNYTYTHLDNNNNQQ